MEPRAPSPNRRFTDTDAPTTVIGAGTALQGDLTGDDTVEIRGTVEGQVRTKSHCVVREGAKVRGNLEAAGILVAGEIEAETLVADKVEIRASARVRGAISARVVVIADGAVYEGRVQMRGADAPDGPAYFTERRKDEGGATRG